MALRKGKVAVLLEQAVSRIDSGADAAIYRVGIDCPAMSDNQIYEFARSAEKSHLCLIGVGCEEETILFLSRDPDTLYRLYEADAVGSARREWVDDDIAWQEYVERIEVDLMHRRNFILAKYGRNVYRSQINVGAGAIH